jgi:uncharacterized protein YjiS (DUF1127 family)
MMFDTAATAQIRGSASGWRLSVRRRLAALAARVRHYRQVQHERTQLRALSDRDLRDIGISRYDALREARKPFWRP